MTPLVDEVESCNTCPFSFRTDARWWCTHPAHGNSDEGTGAPRKLKMSDSDVDGGKTPDWCPLVLTPVLIRRKPVQLGLKEVTDSKQ